MKKAKRRVHTRTHRYLVLRIMPGGTLVCSKESAGLRSVGGVVLLCVLRKAQGSAPRAADAARSRKEECK